MYISHPETFKNRTVLCLHPRTPGEPIPPLAETFFNLLPAPFGWIQIHGSQEPGLIVSETFSWKIRCHVFVVLGDGVTLVCLKKIG